MVGYVSLIGWTGETPDLFILPYLNICVLSNYSSWHVCSEESKQEHFCIINITSNAIKDGRDLGQSTYRQIKKYINLHFISFEVWKRIYRQVIIPEFTSNFLSFSKHVHVKCIRATEADKSWSLSWCFA